MTDPTRYYGGVEPIGDYDQLVAKIDEQAADLDAIEAKLARAITQVRLWKNSKERADVSWHDESHKRMDAQRDLAHAETERDTLATENARLLGLLTELAGRLHGAVLPDSGLHAILDEVDCVIGADTLSEKHPCPLCNGAGEYANVAPCNACGGAGVVD